ncbi:hypothetical protein R1sor_016354 [Riccia sorocarpa]|uniref:FCP1 homology domain-containing protein n=1 Tax=Riccia sorocarpa TaxID=122646 RepID=A0ABD3HER4_9MARC
MPELIPVRDSDVESGSDSDTEKETDPQSSEEHEVVEEILEEVDDGESEENPDSYSIDYVELTAMLRRNMYVDHKCASLALPSCLGVPRPKVVKVETVFADLRAFETTVQNSKGKRKANEDPGTNDPKKPRSNPDLENLQSESSDVNPMDVHGVVGPPKNNKGQEVDRDFSQLSVNRFRPINDLQDDELKTIWSELEKGTVWITRPAKYQGPEDIVSLKDFCKELKGIRALASRILKYWLTRYHEVFGSWDELSKSYPFPDKWLESVLKYIPDKSDALKDVAVEELTSSEEEEGSKKKRKSKKKSSVSEPLPSQIVTQLYKIHCAKHGAPVPRRLEPLEILLIKDINQYQLTLDDEVTCKLVFLDLTHPEFVGWEKQQFSSFLGIVCELTLSTEFVIVAVMEFGHPLVNFSAALKDMRDARFFLECGAYEGERLRRDMDFAYPCWQLVYAFISLGTEDYKPTLVNNAKMRPFSIDFEPKNADEDLKVMAGDGAIQTNVKLKAPRWEFVGMPPLNNRELVHPLCKRRGFCSRMVSNFSAEGSTVLDFFSGGVFTREALMLERDVIYFAHNPAEAEFIGKFSKELVRYSERVKRWFARYKSSKKPGSSSQVPSVQREQPQAQPDNIAGDAEEVPFVVDDLLTSDALERLGNRSKIQLVVEATAEQLQKEQPDNEKDLDPIPRTEYETNSKANMQIVVVEHHQEEHVVSTVEIHSSEQVHVPIETIEEPPMQDNAPGSQSQILALIENNQAVDGLFLGPRVINTDQMDGGNSPDQQQDVQFSGLLLYGEGFMDRIARTAAGDDVGQKKVIRRNGVHIFITRCLELFDIALWTCNDRNTLYDYMFYLFSEEQYDKFLFRWDRGKALDTKERWTRNNRHISLFLKPLKTVWEKFPDFNARNTLLVDVNPYRASANPEDTGIFLVPFTGSYTDRYLTTVLLPYLEGLSQAFDVREYVREHVLQGSLRPLHFRATSRGLLGLLHKFSVQAIETYVPPLLTKREKLSD